MLEPRELGGYQLIRRIAVGGMAEIFEARRQDADCSVVLKVLLPQYAADPEFIAMLEDEAHLAVALEHEHLVRMSALEREGETRFLVMEHVDGPTLAQLISAARRQGLDALPPPPLALEIGRQLLAALAYLHSLTDDEGHALEVVHRDVTPGNVLIDRRAGAIKLADFGIARHRQRQVRTRTGVIKGTVQYMAPEQMAGGGRGAEIDQRADLYCAGLLLFELLTGRPFIDAEGEVNLLRRAENPTWIAPTSVRRDLDQGIDQLLRPALQRFPEERYTSAASFAKALERAAGQFGGGGPAALRAWLEQRELTDAESALAKTSAVEGGRPPQQATRMTRKPELKAHTNGRARRVGAAIASAALALIGLWLILRSPSSVELSEQVPDAAGPLVPSLDVASDACVDLAPARRDLPTVDMPVTWPVRRKRPVMRKHRDDAEARVLPATRTIDPSVALRARRQQLLAGLKQRDLLPSDLPASARSMLRNLDWQLQRTAVDAAERSLIALESAIRAVQVDRALVEAKIKRVHTRLRLRKGIAARRLRDQASQALQTFMDGRYGQANRQLNRILAALR